MPRRQLAHALLSGGSFSEETTFNYSSRLKPLPVCEQSIAQSCGHSDSSTDKPQPFWNLVPSLMLVRDAGIAGALGPQGPSRGQASSLEAFPERGQLWDEVG